MIRRTSRGVVLAVSIAMCSGPAVAASELGRAAHAALEVQRPDAPAIVLHTPRHGGTYASPLGIDIGFEPAQGATIDLSTLKVTVVTHTP